MPRAKDAAASSVTAQSQQDAVSEGIENFELPRSLVTKLARSGMDDNVKMQKDVVLSFQKASTVFINYLAATAHEVATSKQHKSISASDVMKALELVEMADMVPMLQKELQIYRELQKTDKGGRKSISAKGKGREAQGESISAGTSISAKSKEKGKEREKGPTITINPAFVKSRTQSVVEPEPDFQSEDTEEHGQVQQEGVDEDADMLEDEEETEDEVEEEDDEEEGEGDEEPLEDTMTIEEEESSKDARGVDESEPDTAT